MNVWSEIILSSIFPGHLLLGTLGFSGELENLKVTTYRAPEDICLFQVSYLGTDTLSAVKIIPDETPALRSIYQGDASYNPETGDVSEAPSDSYHVHTTIAGKSTFPVITVLDKSRNYTIRVTNSKSRYDFLSESIRVQCEPDTCICKEIEP